MTTVANRSLMAAFACWASDLQPRWQTDPADEIRSQRSSPRLSRRVCGATRRARVCECEIRTRTDSTEQQQKHHPTSNDDDDDDDDESTVRHSSAPITIPGPPDIQNDSYHEGPCHFLPVCCRPWLCERSCDLSQANTGLSRGQTSRDVSLV